jgi:hypothetical protein
MIYSPLNALLHSPFFYTFFFLSLSTSLSLSPSLSVGSSLSGQALRPSVGTECNTSGDKTQHYTALHDTTLHCTARHDTTLHCTTRHDTTLQHTPHIHHNLPHTTNTPISSDDLSVQNRSIWRASCAFPGPSRSRSPPSPSPPRTPPATASTGGLLHPWVSELQGCAVWDALCGASALGGVGCIACVGTQDY